MSLFAQYVLAAILFILGLAAIGGATFGRQRTARIVLAVAGIALWAVTLFLYSNALSRQAEETSAVVTIAEVPTSTPLPSVQTPTSVTATKTPTAVVKTPTATPTPPAEIPGRIAFHSDRSGNFDIWVMNANGTGLQQLTDSPERDIEPDWSPDGEQIVFSSGRDDPRHTQLYIMNADGSNQHRLMDFIEADQVGARWSPDGQWIVFYSNMPTDGMPWLQIYKVRSDGSELVKLSDTPSNDFMPDWSPDGSRLVFVSERDGNRELYVMDADGSNQIRLTNNIADDMRPRWSPDGKTILFESNRDGLVNLYVMDAPPPEVSGPIDQDVQLLTFPGVNDVAPAWAVNGEKILFSSDRDSTGPPNWEIYIMNADGSHVLRLTNHPEADRFAAWTP